jgi:ankyrin repeat protein
MGADPAVATADGNTSYHLAVKRRDRKSLRELMKRRLNREDVELLNDKGLTPLHLAVLARDDTMVKMLLAFGARPDSQVGMQE